LKKKKETVESGYWPIYRYNPQLLAENKNPFIYETRDPKTDMLDFLMGEGRYKVLKREFPENADNLLKRAVQFKKDKHEYYKKLIQLQS